MTIECAWCGCIVGEKDGRGVTGVTSGMCDGCFAAIYAEIAPEESEPAQCAEATLAASAREPWTL